jgi:hypothetical protein
MPGKDESRQFEAELVQAATAARSVVRRKLGVSLRPEDGRRENQDALELVGDIQLRLLRKLQSGDNAARDIHDFDSYAKQAARNTCSEYLRERYPLRALLKNRLRRFFRSRQGYAEWELDGELVCGFAGWRNRREYAPDSARTSEALADPASVAPDAQPRTSFEQIHADDWEVLLDAVLRDLGCALDLDDLVSIVAPRVGVKDVPVTTGKSSADEADPLDAAQILEPLQKSAGPDAEAYLRELLGALWQTLLRIDARKRCAFLLNPPNMEIELFPTHGIASITDIGRAIGLSEQHFAVICDELTLAPAALALARSSRAVEEKFAAIWNALPLQDALIGKILGLSQQQVINQRMLARRVLSREMAPFLSRGKK